MPTPELATEGRAPTPASARPAWEQQDNGPLSDCPRTRQHRLRTTLKTHHRLRLPQLLFLGEMQLANMIAL
jgi:hypothetical protein